VNGAHRTRRRRGAGIRERAAAHAILAAGVISLCCAWPAWIAAGRDHGSERTIRSSCGAFIIRYPARLDAMAGTVEEFLCESTGTIASMLGLGSIDTITVLIAPGIEGYRRLHGGRLPDWSAAYSDIDAQVLGLNSRAVVGMRRPIRIVIRHELSHLLLAQRVGGVRCPTWFLEGLAMMQSGEWGFGDEWRLASRITRGEIPYLEDLEGPFPVDADDAAFAYGISYIAVQELLRERGGDLITLTAFIRELGDFDEAFATTFGESPAHFDGRLHVILYERYRNVGALIRTAPYWPLAALLFLCAFLVRRHRNRRRLEEWERREANDT
jgi:hypothetical protein